MYKHILLGVDTQLKNEKALKEVSHLAGKDTVVTILNAINEQDAQASIKAGVHLDELTEEKKRTFRENKKSIRGLRY